MFVEKQGSSENGCPHGPHSTNSAEQIWIEQIEF